MSCYHSLPLDLSFAILTQSYALFWSDFSSCDRCHVLDLAVSALLDPVMVAVASDVTTLNMVRVRVGVGVGGR